MLKSLLCSLIISVSPSIAETLTIKLSPTPKSADHLYTTIVANCWADTTPYPHQKYEMILGQVHNIDPQDAPALKAAAEAWVNENREQLNNIILPITSSDTDHKVVYVLGLYTMNTFFKLRASFNKAMKATATPSGICLRLATNTKGRFAASIPVAEVKKVGSKKAYKAVRLITRRLRQNEVIYPKPYFEIALTNPQIIITP